MTNRRLQLKKETNIEPEVIPVERVLERKNIAYQDIREDIVKDYGELYKSYVKLLKERDKNDISKVLLGQMNQHLIIVFEEIYKRVGENFDKVHEFCIESIRKYTEKSGQKK